MTHQKQFLKRLTVLGLLAAAFLQGCGAKYKFIAPEKVAMGVPVLLQAKVESVLAKEASGWSVTPETEAVQGEERAVFEKILNDDLEARLKAIRDKYAADMKKREDAARESAAKKKELASQDEAIERDYAAAVEEWKKQTSDEKQAAWKEQLAEMKKKADATVPSMDAAATRYYLVLAGSNEWKSYAKGLDGARKSADWMGAYRVVNNTFQGAGAAQKEWTAIFQAWIDYVNFIGKEPKKIPHPQRNYRQGYYDLQARIRELDAMPSVESLQAKMDKELQDERDKRFNKDFGLRKFFAFKPADAGKTFSFVWDKTHCSDCTNTDAKIEVTGPKVTLGTGSGTISGKDFSVGIQAAVENLGFWKENPAVKISLAPEPAPKAADQGASSEGSVSETAGADATVSSLLYEGPATLEGNGISVKLSGQKHDLGSMAKRGELVDANAEILLNGVSIGSVAFKFRTPGKWELRDAKVGGSIDLKAKTLTYELAGTFPNQDRWDGDEVIGWELGAVINRRSVVLDSGTFEKAAEGRFGTGSLSKSLESVDYLKALESAGQSLPVLGSFLLGKKKVASAEGTLKIPGNKPAPVDCGVNVNDAGKFRVVQMFPGNSCSGSSIIVTMYAPGLIVRGTRLSMDFYTDDPSAPGAGPIFLRDTYENTYLDADSNAKGLDRGWVSNPRKLPFKELKTVLRCGSEVVATAITRLDLGCKDGGGGGPTDRKVNLRLIKAEGSYALSQAAINAVATQVVQTPVATTGATPVPTAAPTAAPSATPTFTAVPTSTPVPTATPMPPTPTPTPDPCTGDPCSSEFCPGYDPCSCLGPCDFTCPFATCDPTCPQYIGC
jgi:hypothetical protein